MTELFAFMGAHPILTVILTLIMCQTLIYTAEALRGTRCSCQHDDDEGRPPS